MDFKEQAATIFQQIGGISRLRLMVGGHSFGYSNTDRTAHFMFKLCRKANTLYVRLNPDDTYTMEFARVGLRIGIKKVETFENVYAEDLVPIFKRFTGLELAIPRIIGINAK